MKIKTKRGARRVRNQRVRDKRFVVTDYTGCSYITAGKLYRWSYCQRSGLGEIRGENDCMCYILFTENCPHLNNIGTWYHPIR